MFVSKPANEAVVLCFTIFLNQKGNKIQTELGLLDSEARIVLS